MKLHLVMNMRNLSEFNIYKVAEILLSHLNLKGGIEMSEMVIGKKTGVPALRARRPAPKLRPKNKEDNKMVSSKNKFTF